MSMITRAGQAWLNCGARRQERRRYKDFTYGRQWEDDCVTPDGRRMSERRRMEEEGRVPITNNIIRQMVKSIVGRYRYLLAESAGEDESANRNLLTTSLGSSDNEQAEADARTLEEFLISGMAIQRIEQGVGVNVSPERFFYENFERANGSDCRLMGMLHDFSPSQALEMFAGGDPSRASALKEAFRGSMMMQSAFAPHSPIDFAMPAIPGTWRVVEVWELTGSEWLEVHDPFSHETYREEPDALYRLEGLNRARADIGSPLLEWKHRASEQWRQRWLTASGILLGEQTGGEPPFVLKFYPMIDGEVHSLVEDVIHQQKYVNRLISLLDHIISSSAKGVLLYPADQLPDGFTWRDLRRIWSTPNGIMPYKRTAKGISPEQVHTGSAVGAGATEMLKTQLQLFEEISGSTGALRGKSSSAAGEGMFRAELENATITLLDLLASFRAFTRERDNRISKNERT